MKIYKTFTKIIIFTASISLLCQDIGWTLAPSHKKETIQQMQAIGEKLVERKESRPAGVPEVNRKMPVWHLLEAVGLLPASISHIAAQKINGVMIRRLSLRGPSNLKGDSHERFNTIKKELGGEEFDMIFNEKEELIAVFSLNPVNNLYFDLSAYYFEVPEFDDPEFKNKWRRFIERRKKDESIIEDYKKRRFGGSRGDILPLGHNYALYSFCVINKKGKYFARDVNIESMRDLDTFMEYLSRFKDIRNKIVFPVFPTVYSASALFHYALDKDFLQNVYDKLNSGDDVLVTGPGSGVDAWIAAIKTGREVYAVGINPLEIANLKATASLGKFEVIAKVHDNVISEDGVPAFPDKKFDWALWDMPEYNPNAGEYVSFTELWDPDFGGKSLRRYVSAMPMILKPYGHGLIWNVREIDREYHNDVMRILKSGGRWRKGEPPPDIREGHDFDVDYLGQGVYLFFFRGHDLREELNNLPKMENIYSPAA